MDDLDLYDDLDEFQQQQEKKSKELQDVEDKYTNALETIKSLEEENKGLHKKIHRMELSFQSLLDTARTEIKRKDKEIERLRKEKDDICFRRKLPNHPVEKSTNRPKTDKSSNRPAEKISNHSAEKTTIWNPEQNTESIDYIPLYNEKESIKYKESEECSRPRSSDRFVESHKRNRSMERQDFHDTKHQRSERDKSSNKSVDRYFGNRDRDNLHRKEVSERNDRNHSGNHNDRDRRTDRHYSYRESSKSPHRSRSEKFYNRKQSPSRRDHPDNEKHYKRDPDRRERSSRNDWEKREFYKHSSRNNSPGRKVIDETTDLPSKDHSQQRSNVIYQSYVSKDEG